MTTARALGAAFPLTYLAATLYLTARAALRHHRRNR